MGTVERLAPRAGSCAAAGGRLDTIGPHGKIFYRVAGAVTIAGI
jgi:hypothetical protein